MSAELVIPVDTREELVSLLCEAAELEHGLSCSYLFAAFSLKRGAGEGLTATQLEAVSRWRKTIKQVAEEEMLHLALVSNLLTALGAAPHLTRPAFPQTSPYYPAGITIELRRFDEQTLTRFIFLERPEHVDVEPEATDDPGIDPDAEVPLAAPGALLTVEDEDREAADPASYSTIGHLYQTIDDALVALVAERGEHRVFIGPPRAQASNAFFELAELEPVTDLASARAALETLTTQGEGVRGDWTEAHYGRFLAIRDELRAYSSADAGFEPAWPVLTNPTVDGGDADDGAVVHDPATLAVMQLFNVAYTLMTAMLLRVFAHTDESEDALKTLARSTVEMMEDVMSPLGSVLATLPAGGDALGEGATAGASFEFTRSITLLPHRRSAWLVFHERLTELAAHAARLADESGVDALRDVGEAFTSVAASLEPHLDVEPLLA